MCKTPISPSHSDEEQNSLHSFNQEAAEPLEEKPVDQANSEEAIPEQEQALSDQQEDLEKTQKHGN